MQRVQIEREITAPIAQVFEWFAQSENFATAKMVFATPWQTVLQRETGAVRDVWMVAGWYREEITDFVVNEKIQYRVQQSFPPVQQDFTEIAFVDLGNGATRVIWTIELNISLPLMGTVMTAIGAQMAVRLYGSILTAAQRQLNLGAERV